MARRASGASAAAWRRAHPAAVISILRRSARPSTFTSSVEAIHAVPSFDIGRENRLPSSIYKAQELTLFRNFVPKLLSRVIIG
jgi:hypothetical protein